MPLYRSPSNSALEIKLRNFLMDTWLPVAALALMAKIPTKTALAILQRNEREWQLDCVRVRIDGHNPVHCYRKRSLKLQQVLGVWMPVAEVVESEVGNG